MIIRKILKKCLNLLFPLTCLGCGRPSTQICEDCLKNIRPLGYQECSTCRRPSIKGEFCSENCKNTLLKEPVAFDNLIVCSRYDKKGVLKKLIEELKYHYSEETALILANFLKEKLKSLKTENQIIVPVPLHYKRIKERGFNQAEALLKAVNENQTKALKRIINTEKQAHLNKSERLKNIKNAFEINKNFANEIINKHIILIDDVCTTGATINECAKVLKQNGACQITALVLARGY